MNRRGGVWVVLAGMFVLGLFLLPPVKVWAASDDGAFSLQVSPSPLVTNVKPGQTTELELKIRNGGNTREELKIETRGFKIDAQHGGTIKLDDMMSVEFSKWVTFSAPNFTVEPGQWYTQKVRLSAPENSGFSYSFALVISRKDVPVTKSGRLLNGSVAVFTLINIDRPGATRKLEINSFSSKQRVYEYLPAELVISLKNTGNTIVQPYGNVFIQRKAGSETIDTLPVNKSAGYILPGTTRSLTANWKDGFPYYDKRTTPTGTVESKIKLDWSHVDRVRFGRYTAKVIAVYNDGQRDVPLEATLSFWVIPWKILLVLLVVLVIVLAGLWSIGRKIWRLLHRHNKIKKEGDQ